MTIRELLAQVFGREQVELHPDQVTRYRTFCVNRKAAIMKIRNKRKQLRKDAKKLRKHMRPRKQGRKRRRRKSTEKGSK